MAVVPFSRKMIPKQQGYCIRIEKPLDMAEYVLRGDSRWTRETIVSAIESKETRIVNLPEPIPVYILYWTAWVDEKTHTVEFREDIYKRDEKLEAALRQVQPAL